MLEGINHVIQQALVSGATYVITRAKSVSNKKMIKGSARDKVKIKALTISIIPEG